MKSSLAEWFASLHNRPGGDILAVQTMRNALMAASVLASAALVGLMGVLATAHLHARWSSASAATLLVVSATCSLRALWTLSAAGFDLRLGASPLAGDTPEKPNPAPTSPLVQELTTALRAIRWSGVLLILALAAAGASVWAPK
jgi:Protein of unknown function, DUF599